MRRKLGRGAPGGIGGVSWLVSRPRFGGFPLTAPLPRLVGAATVAGIGFTVSLLIADISFEGRDLEDAKLGILAASMIASGLAWLAFVLIRRASSETGRTPIVAPIVDLAEPVDPEVDHVRGNVDAPVTLVEYGDFECPHCGRAEPDLRALPGAFGDDLAFVFRHLPLPDVHPRAQLAAEAAEAAGAQGRFWDMHDLLFSHQDALTIEALRGYADDLGLDLARFNHDLDERRWALRVERDVLSADDSGAAGTPTFFVNGRRHQGKPDQDSLVAALRRAGGARP